MEFEIHEVCHTYSQLLGIDTVHVKVFYCVMQYKAICHIKERNILQKQTLKTTHHILMQLKCLLTPKHFTTLAKKKKEEKEKI